MSQISAEVFAYRQSLVRIRPGCVGHGIVIVGVRPINHTPTSARIQVVQACRQPDLGRPGPNDVRLPTNTSRLLIGIRSALAWFR